MAEGESGPGQLSDLAQRLVKTGARVLHNATERLRDRDEIRVRDIPKELVVSVANLGVRGKEEVMTLVAQEVRSYLGKLRVGSELRSLLTEHSLEINASIRLKSVLEGDEVKGEDVRVGGGLKKVEG